MRKKDWGKYLFEGLLIVFSVLLALFLNQVMESKKINHQKEIVLESISRELKTNLEAVKYMRDRHVLVNERVERMISGEEDSLISALEENKYFDLSVITNNQSLIDQFISSTSWETAKSMGIISEMEYELVEKLTLVYAMQDILMNQTIKSISNSLIFDRETHNMDQVDETLIQFNLRFNELVGQEWLMIQLLQDAVDYLDTQINE